MRAWGLVLASLLVASILAGCMGPPGAAATTQPKFRSYGPRGVYVDVPGIESREPNCPPPTEDGPCSEYFLVRVRGSENATLVSGPDVARPCSSRQQWKFDVDEGGKGIEYNGTMYKGFPPRLNTLVAEEMHGVVFGEASATTGCLSSNGLYPYNKQPTPSFRKIVGNYGAVNVTVYRAGNIVVDKTYFFELGKKLVVSYGLFRTVGDSTYFVQGGFEVVNMGAWPREQLAAAG